MKRAMICLMTVVVLVLTLLPAGMPMVLGQAEDGPAVTGETSEGQTPGDEGTGDAMGGGESIDDPTVGGQPAGDETAGGGATEDQDVGDQVVDGQAEDDEPVNDQPAIDEAANDGAAEDEPCGCQDADDDTGGDETTDDENVDGESGADEADEEAVDESPATEETTDDESALVADFDFEIECSDCRTKSVKFTDQSTGGTREYEYDWDFGDGGKHSKKQNPGHWYWEDGDYNVTLTVTDSDGNVASTSQTVTIGAGAEGEVEPLGSNTPTVAGGTWPRCISGCQASDVEVTDVYLDVHGCADTGDYATADVYVEFYNKANERYCVVFVADLWTGGNLSSENVWFELGTIPGHSYYTARVATIAWPCGSTLELRNVLIMWRTSDKPCHSDCGDYKAKSQCHEQEYGDSAIPAVVQSVEQSSDHPCPGEDVVITAHVTDADGTVTSVNLTYGSTTVPMVPTGGTPEDGYWEATIEGQLAGTTLTIVVTARDNDGNIVSTPAHSKTWSGPDCTITTANATCAYSTGNTASTPSAGAGASYNWTITGGTITGGQNTRAVTWTAGAAGTATISVTVTSAYGCECSDSVEVTVYQLPACHISADPGTQVCAGTNVTLREDGGDAVSWSWTTGATTQSIVVNASGVYGVTVTDENGCTSYCEIEITVYDEPSCSISANPGTEVCAGNNVTLTEDSGDAVSWSWTTGATTQSIVVNASGVYGVTVTDENGCTSYCEIEITVHEPPACHITADPGAAVCAGNNVTLTEDGGDAISWSWTTGATTQSIVVSSGGTYGVTVTDENGCTGYCQIEITVYELPAATASSNSPVNQGGTIQLYGGPDDMASYYWTGPNSFTSTSQNATIPNATTAMAGNYTLTVTNEHGCSDTATTNVVVVTVPEVTPVAVGGGGCPTMKYLTVDWEGCITEKPLYSNDRLIVDLLGPSPDSVHNLLLERGTHAPVVGRRTHYLITIRELENPPTTPENTVAVVAFNVTPSGAVFDRDIFLTLGLNQTQLPENALNVSMAYYDDVTGAWVPLDYEAGGPSGVAELTLSAPIKHFSIFGVLATVGAPPGPEPARFVASGLSIQPSIEKIWEAVTFAIKTGRTVTITANIHNDGGQEGTYTAVLKLNGKTVDSKTVTLGAGQSRQVSFTRSGLEYGRYEVEVAGLSGEFTASQTVAWWLVIVLIVALGLIIWGVVWGRRRGRKASEAE